MPNINTFALLAGGSSISGHANYVPGDPSTLISAKLAGFPDGSRLLDT